MNQILQVNENQNGREKKNLTLFIVIGIIILIVLAIIIGALILNSNSNPSIANKNITNQNTVNQNTNVNNIIGSQEPQIMLRQMNTTKLRISVESPMGLGLSKLIYNWNYGQEETINIDGNTSMERIVDIPMGRNTIYISLFDINNKEYTWHQEFGIEDNPVIDRKPLINLAVIGNNIKIEVTSEIELSKISYQWNSENEKVDDMLTYEDKMNYEKQIEIPIGQNNLLVVAEDIEGNRTEISQVIKGITKAITTVDVANGYWYFTVIGKENIKKVEFVFNGKKAFMDTTTFGETKRVSYKVKLEKGKNYLIITSTTESDGIDSTTWEQEYTEE